MKSKDDVIIVTKNLNQMKWLKNHGITGKIKSYISIDEAAGKHIIGAVPYVVGAAALDVTLIDCKPIGTIKSKDMTSEQLEAQNAELRTYRVIPL